MNSRKLILYISSSLDGFIAKPNDDLSFLNMLQIEGEDYGYADFVSNIDTVIMGRKTYDWVMNQVDTFPHAEKETYIITTKDIMAVGNTTFYNGDLSELVNHLKSKIGKNIYCDGGAQLVDALLKEKLIDEIIVTIAPVILGAGTRLFQNNTPETELELISTKSYSSGAVQYHYAFTR